MGKFGLYELLIVFIFVILIFIWFNINIASAMNKISDKNRKMDGGLVWLNIIPLLNFVWPFIFNNALRESYRKEFKEKGIPYNVNLSSGFLYPSAPILAYLISVLPIDFYSYSDLLVFSVFTILVALTGLIFQIIFWVNVNRLKEILLNSQDSVSPTKVFNDNIPVEKVTFITDNTPPPSPKESSIIDNQIPTKQKETSIDKLKKYHEMLNDGLINQNDFDKIKDEILKNGN
jgi:hypothetical protein